MNSRQPLINSLGVSIGNFQINCILEKQDLKISVSCLAGDQLMTKLAMSRMTAEQESLNFWISAVGIENCCPWKDSQEREREKSIEKFMLQKIAQMQTNFRVFSSRLTSPAPPQISKRANISEKESPLQAMIIKDEKEIGKLQNLNDILQEKLVEKQVRIISLQKKLYEQDELVHELAEKLMVANTDKDDIFNQYEKILQTTVFRSKGEEELAEFIASMDGQERMGLTQSMKGMILKIKEQEEGSEEKEKKQSGQEHVEKQSNSSHSSISPKEDEKKYAHSSNVPLQQ